MASRSGRSGRPRSVRTPENVTAASRVIQDELHQSIRRLAKKLGCQEPFLQNLAHHDVNMQSRTIQDKPLLTETTRLRRMERSKLPLNLMKTTIATNNVRISDEKLFHMDA